MFLTAVVSSEDENDGKPVEPEKIFDDIAAEKINTTVKNQYTHSNGFFILIYLFLGNYWEAPYFTIRYGYYPPL